MTGQPASPQRTDPSTDPDLIRADTDGMIDRSEEGHHPVNTDPREPTTRAQALAEAKEWGSTLSHWNRYCGIMGDRDRELELCAQADLQEQQRLILLAQDLPAEPEFNAASIIAGREPSASLTIAAAGTKGNAMERLGALYDALYDHELLSTPDPHWQQTGPRVKDAFCAAFLAAFPGPTRASSSYEEDYPAARKNEQAQQTGFLEGVLDGIASKARQALKGRSAEKVRLLYEITDSANAALRRPAMGTRVLCLIAHRGNGGTVVGWDQDLSLPLIEWDELRGLPPEACEQHEFTTDLNEEIQR